ncbi:MAG: saccharopine dehydrogenase NADP-binding domain-containing protein [Acidobacteria bacterium]|nr:saccharopine dehydrogenase NADP-binding domain-containing protein [Acidobacteriota bacterium]
MKFAILGVGKVGYGAACYILDNVDPDKIGLFDSDDKFIQALIKKYKDRNLETLKLDLDNTKMTVEKLKGYDAVICCLPYHLNKRVAEISLEAGCHYTDLGGNDTVTDSILAMDDKAKEAGVSLVPDCGLAPGLVSVIAADFVDKLGNVDEIKLKVGGLPKNPVPPFNYQVTFNAQGLINEYKEPVRILRNGKEKIVESLKGLEFFEFPGIGGVEAFYTSGGLSTLTRTLNNKVDNISYKTIRFPGHCNILNSLRDTGFFDEKPLIVHKGSKTSPRKFLEAMLEQRYTSEEPDMILLYTSAIENSKEKAVYHFIDYGDKKHGLSAMQKCTAIPIAVASVLQAEGKLKEPGAKPQELVFNASDYLDKVVEWGIEMKRESH